MKITTHHALYPLAAVLLLASLLPSVAQAGIAVGSVVDKNSQPVANAVIFAIPLDTAAPLAKNPEPIVIAQENYAFVPYVSVIQSGTSVRFPNRDAHDHHLKSFSPAKTFSLKTYSKKEEPNPILFDKSGEVALVCHIHNWMRGFVYVVDTPWFAKTDPSGNAVIQNLPPGKYEIKAWVPTMFGAPLTKTVQIQASGSSNVSFQFDFVPRPAPKPPAKSQWEDTYHSH